MASGSVRGGRRLTSGTWTFGASARTTARLVHAEADQGGLRTYYDIRYPGHEREAGGRCESRAPRLAPRARRRIRRDNPAGERVTGMRQRLAVTSRLRPNGWAGIALVARDRAPTSGCARDRGPVRRVLVRQIESRGPAQRSCSSSSATTAVRGARSGQVPTRRCWTAAAGSSAISPSRASRGPLSDRHRNRVRNTTRAGSAVTAR